MFGKYIQMYWSFLNHNMKLFQVSFVGDVQVFCCLLPILAGFMVVFLILFPEQNAFNQNFLESLGR